MREHPVELVRSRLGDVHPKSGGGYTARCPAHEDARDSLSIDAGEDGRALLKCFAGCDIKDILAAMELTMPDLFPSRNGGGGGDYYPLLKGSNTRTPRKQTNKSKKINTVREDRRVEVFESNGSNTTSLA